MSPAYLEPITFEIQNCNISWFWNGCGNWFARWDFSLACSYSTCEDLGETTCRHAIFDVQSGKNAIWEQFNHAQCNVMYVWLLVTFPCNSHNCVLLCSWFFSYSYDRKAAIYINPTQFIILVTQWALWRKSSPQFRGPVLRAKCSHSCTKHLWRILSSPF